MCVKRRYIPTQPARIRDERSEQLWREMAIQKYHNPRSQQLLSLISTGKPSRRSHSIRNDVAVRKIPLRPRAEGRRSLPHLGSRAFWAEARLSGDCPSRPRRERRWCGAQGCAVCRSAGVPLMLLSGSPCLLERQHGDDHFAAPSWYTDSPGVVFTPEQPLIPLDSPVLVTVRRRRRDPRSLERRSERYHGSWMERNTAQAV